VKSKIPWYAEEIEKPVIRGIEETGLQGRSCVRPRDNPCRRIAGTTTRITHGTNWMHQQRKKKTE
jgi:hypothetical protein